MEPYEGFFIIRCYSAGVFFARIKEHDRANKVIELTNVRKIHFWSGAAAVEQLAMEGVKHPGNCRITMEVPSMIVAEPIQIIPCTREAVECIKTVTAWKIG